MAKKFVRNITGTTLTGKDKEPLFTNMQNDLLSDGEDVAVRNKKEYHLLTDNLKTHLVKTNAFMSISEKEKNGLKLNVLQASDTEVKNAVDTPRVINPKQAKDMIEQRTPKIVRDIIETDVPQSDWNETDPNSKAFIRNKPDIENGGGGGVTVPDFSSQAQAETGTNNNTIMTPKSTKQAIDKQVPLIVADQVTTIIEQNFEALPQPDWDETNVESHGFIKNKPMFATTEETANGKLGNKIVTPLGLEYALDVMMSEYKNLLDDMYLINSLTSSVFYTVENNMLKFTISLPYGYKMDTTFSDLELTCKTSNNDNTGVTPHFKLLSYEQIKDGYVGAYNDSISGEILIPEMENKDKKLLVYIKFKSLKTGENYFVNLPIIFHE